MHKRSLFVFRQDLRVCDNRGLRQCVADSYELIPCFVFDMTIFVDFPDRDPRIRFVADAVMQLREHLRQCWSDLLILEGNPVDLIPQMIAEYECDALYRNRSYGDNSLWRDTTMVQRSDDHDVITNVVNDYLLVEPEAIIPMKVFTPFKNRWLKHLKETPWILNDEWLFDLVDGNTINTPVALLNNNHSQSVLATYLSYPDSWRDVTGWSWRLDSFWFISYDNTRNLPAVDGSSKLSPYTRFGVVSIRQIYNVVASQCDVFVSELVWREFWQHIAYHFPFARAHSFQEKRRWIQRENKKEWFDARCEWRTWYPLVDAGMRQLRQEYRMHNRVRMVVASFLTKDLLIDRSRGEQEFARYLIDYDKNVNVGNRQRSASVWADPKPLRIFNPSLQAQRFDPQAIYIKKYVPELRNAPIEAIMDPLKYDLTTYGYVLPIVDHAVQRKKAMDMYKHAVSS